MKGYHNKVNTLARRKNETEVTLVINLFQSVLDGFIRGEIKRVEAEPAKASMKASVCTGSSVANLTFWNLFQATKTTKKRRKKDKCVI